MFRGLVHRIQIELFAIGEGRELGGQQGALRFARHLPFVFQQFLRSVLLALDVDLLFQAFQHAVKTDAEAAEFIE